MRFPIRHERYQHAVGHGFFHTGSVCGAARDEVFNYVYDVGAKKTSTLLTPRVEEYVDSLGGRRVDMLVLSHLHADHVSGLDRLLATCDVTLVVLPYIAPIERIVLLAAHLVSGRLDASYVQLITDTSGALHSRGVGRVLTVTAEAPKDITPSDATQSDAKPDDQPGGGWGLAKRVDPKAKNASEVIAAPTDEMSHAIPLGLGPATDARWTFKFFCYSSDALSGAMNPILVDAFNLPPSAVVGADLTSWALKQLRSPAGREKLTHAYRKLVGARRLNWTSLCMWSGPLSSKETRPYGEHWYAYGGEALRSSSHPRPLQELAWFGTGDAHFGDSDVAAQVGRHFSGEDTQSGLASMSLPHHGSAENHNLALLRELDPAITYVTCPAPRDGVPQKHPGVKVETQIAKWRGRKVLRVDEVESNSLREWVQVHFSR